MIYNHISLIIILLNEKIYLLSFKSSLIVYICNSWIEPLIIKNLEQFSECNLFNI